MTELLKPRTVAKLLAVSPQKLRDMVGEGRIETVNLGPRSLRFRRADIDALLSRKRPEASQQDA
ncbi:MAG: helix-turn-helix domain-containing protein [Planctomycetota bacterium]